MCTTYPNLRKTLPPFLKKTREELASSVGLTLRQIEAMRDNLKIVAFQTGEGDKGQWYYPAWQESEGRLISGLDEVIRDWPGAQMSLAVYGSEPQRALGGETPASVLAQGGVSEVLVVIRQLPKS